MLWLDGNRVEDGAALFPAQERGLLLGDGLFETLRIERGQPLLLKRHLQRMEGAAAALGLKPDFSAVEDSARKAASDSETASMRITVFRGSGPRGLLPPKTVDHRTLVSISPSGPRQPALRTVIIAETRRNEGSPLSRMKCVSYADQVIARMEADALGCDDAIMLNNKGEPASTSCANLLVKTEAGWVTPPVEVGLLPGIVREVLIEKGVVVEARIGLEAIRIHPILRTNSLIGIEPLELEGGPVAEPRDYAALTETLIAAERDEA